MTDFRVVAVADGYDLDIQYNDLVLIGGEDDTYLELVAQRIRYAMLTWLGESPFDRDAGIPYTDGVFGRQPIGGVAFLFYQRIAAVEGVDGISDIRASLDNETRILTLSVDVIVGTRPLTVDVGVSA
jgi:hypothetical protein